MNKKELLIVAAIVLAVIVCVTLFVKYAPLWVSLISAGTFLLGGVSGYVIRMLYVKYVKK